MHIKSFLQTLQKHALLIFGEKRCCLCYTPFSQAPASDCDKSNLENKTHREIQENTLEKFLYLQQRHIKSYLCEECAKKIEILHKGFCPKCGEHFADKNLVSTLCATCSRKSPPWQKFTFIGLYQSALRELVLGAKFHNNLASIVFLGKLLAHVWLYEWLFDFTQKEVFSSPTILIPIPLHTKRLKIRGYNQCIELSRYFLSEVSKISQKHIPPEFFAKHKRNGDNISITDEILNNSKKGQEYSILPKILLNHNILTRNKFASPQTLLSAKERHHNIRKSFRIDKSAISQDFKGSHVLILDDIATTNATLVEASEALLMAGASRVDILVVAKSSFSKQIRCSTLS